MARILITGASDGLGRALAEELAAAGHELIVHGRDPVRLAQAAAATGGHPVQADLSSLAEVRQLAAQVTAGFDRLDVLVNNAGVGFGAPGEPRQLSPDGHELRFAVNYLAPVLLTRLLLPLLRRAPAARIVNVASVGQRRVDLDDVMMEHGYDGTVAYRRAKLALVAHSFDLADELAATGITVNSLHPATLMPTTMVRQSGMERLDSLEQGLRATARLVVDPELTGVTGRYFDGEQESRANDQAYDPEFRARLRTVTDALVAEPARR
ncbi:SDR family NAD(P)-dependent oxidoreductase [Micromonospora sp. NPDC049679]|uniref:SDR family NAD(P)-dependent oxidoreductase n=1 Tax=Micromonospora sp. NPDC049679 TaxID=3155920 RepID=UPI0033D771CF